MNLLDTDYTVMCNKICRFKCKIEDNSTSDSFSLDGKDNVMKSLHGNAVQVPGVNAVKGQEKSTSTIYRS